MDVWRRLAEALGSRAPASLRSLRPGARADRLEAAQTSLRTVFHPVVRTGLERNDGAADIDATGAFVRASYFLPGNYRLYSAAEMERRHQMLMQILPGMVAEDPSYLGWWWHPLWIPIAGDVSDTCLVVDHTEGTAFGRVAQFDPTGHVAWADAPQLAVFLDQTASALMHGGGVGHWAPEVDDGVLSWKVSTPRDV